jgi:hypothetical protein
VSSQGATGRAGVPLMAYPAVLALGTVDAAGYSIIGPVVPAISEQTDAGPGSIGALVAS